MREVLRRLMAEAGCGPDHAGLAYDVWAPSGRRGDKDASDPAGWDAWLNWLAGPVDGRDGRDGPDGRDGRDGRDDRDDRSRGKRLRGPDGYACAFKRWEASLQDDRTLCFVAEARGRLLVGHGNPAPTEVGLTLHRTWGVPVIPGSALKGLTAHYVQTTFGPDLDLDQPTGPHPRDPAHPQPDRAPFQGVRWDKQGVRILQGPGELYRRLFGAPEVDETDPHEPGAHEGRVIFHDALWIPDTPEDGRLPLVRDVLTVHQGAYYRDGRRQGVWPNDYESPTPVAFLSVRPKARFLVALSLAPSADGHGEADRAEDAALLRRAARYLRKALDDWGIGGKTAAGYGRMAALAGSATLADRAAPEEESAITELRTWLQGQAVQLSQQAQLAELEARWLPRLEALPEAARAEAARHIKRAITARRKTRERLARLVARLASGR